MPVRALAAFADQASRLLEIGERQLGVLRALVRAAEETDLAKLQELVRLNERLNRDGNTIARDIGATACAGE